MCDAVGVDEIVFNLNEDGSSVVSIELRVFRSELQQVGYVNRTGWTNGQDDPRGLYAGRMTCGICNTLGMKALNCLLLYDLVAFYMRRLRILVSLATRVPLILTAPP
jgi:hypothetical protein